MKDCRGQSLISSCKFVDSLKNIDRRSRVSFILASFHGARIQPRLENINKHAEK